MSNTDLHEAIGRLKRSQPRNEDTMAVCSALEAYLYRPPAELPRTVQTEAAGGFDKKAYQRDYMRKRRAMEKASKGE